MLPALRSWFASLFAWLWSASPEAEGFWDFPEAEEEAFAPPRAA